MRCGIWLVVAVCVCSLLVPVAAEEPKGWRAGAASVQITPPELMWLAGYGAREEPAHGVAQELYAKALALEDADGNRLVMVTTDLIGILRGVRDAVEREVGERFDLPPEGLLLNASHTHCGPEYRTGRGRDEEAKAYRDFLENRLVEVVGKALDSLEPAELVYGQSRAGFAANRRGDPDGRRGPYWPGVVDHDVPVLRAVDSNGDVRAVLFGYACHATTLSWVSREDGQPRYEVNGDYPGYAQQYVEEAFPQAVGLFMAGCGGDQNPYPRRQQLPGFAPLEMAKHHGRTLATAVVAGTQAAPQVTIEPTLGRAFEDVELQRTGSNSGPFPYPVQVIRLGDQVVLTALASEVVVDYSLRIKDELGHSDGAAAGLPAVWVAGYSNGYFGYVPSERILEEGGYEAGPWEPGLEQRIIDAIHRMNDRLKEERETSD